MTGKIEASAHALKGEIMDVHDFRKPRSHRPQAMLEFGISHQLFRTFNRRRLTLDVRQDVGNLGNVTPHVSFELRYLVMGVFQAHALIELDVLLYVNAAGELLNADVVNVQVPVSRDRPDPVENVLRTLGTRQGLNRDVGVGQYATNGIGYGGGELTGALKSDGAGKANGKIGEIAVAGTPDTHTIDFQDSIHSRDGVVDLRPHPGGGGVEQGIDGAPGQTPADGDHHPGNKQGSNRVGDPQPVQVIFASHQDQHQPQNNHARRPYVGREV